MQLSVEQQQILSDWAGKKLAELRELDRDLTTMREDSAKSLADRLGGDFLAVVEQIRVSRELSEVDAMAAAAQEHPDLYNSYRLSRTSRNV